MPDKVPVVNCVDSQRWWISSRGGIATALCVTTVVPAGKRGAPKVAPVLAGGGYGRGLPGVALGSHQPERNHER